MSWQLQLPKLNFKKLLNLLVVNNLLLKVKYFEIDVEAPISSEYDSGYRISKAYG